MLYVIGVGIGDLTLRGLEAARRCGKVYLETYTSILPQQELSAQIGKPIHPADRALIEQHADQFLAEARDGDVALLIAGDPLLATTHTDLLQRARQAGVQTAVIHNASVFSLVGRTGLQLYKFGKTTSIPFPAPGFEPKTPVEILAQNQSISAHTLFLLDLNPKEGKYLSIADAIAYLLKISDVITPETMAVGCAWLGSADQRIVYATLAKLSQIDFGAPPYCLIIPAKLHFAEEEFLEQFKIS